jgi:hypothetical protein
MTSLRRQWLHKSALAATEFARDAGHGTKPRESAEDEARQQPHGARASLSEDGEDGEDGEDEEEQVERSCAGADCWRLRLRRGFGGQALVHHFAGNAAGSSRGVPLCKSLYLMTHLHCITIPAFPVLRYAFNLLLKFTPHAPPGLSTWNL